jgi:hypothetical protein
MAESAKNERMEAMSACQNVSSPKLVNGFRTNLVLLDV